MTLEKALFTVDELKPNQIERAWKIYWVSLLDQRVYKEIISTHALDAATPPPPAPYTQETPGDTELLVKAPYEEVYRFFLEMQIDLANLEYDKYNNSLALFANAWGQYARDYHRGHKPLPGPAAFHF